ncbi:MAG: ComEA family DNA-binding protein [Bacilli bacterium]|nr:ComEA family DNA-binding protein [Bacilli bacterium]
MTFHYRYRKQIIIGVIIFILLGVTTFFIIKNNLSTQKKTIPKKTIVEKKKKKEKEIINYLEVDIKGEVITPGIYKLKEGSRVIDVINAAGGLTENSNTTVINLSKKIVDEMVIIIYSNSQVEDFSKTKEIENQVIDYCNQVDENSLHNDACISKDSSSTPTGKISINNATVEELMTLPGVGEAKAKSIIEYRNSNGPFISIEDITKVSGIGDNLFAQIKEYITT